MNVEEGRSISRRAFLGTGVAAAAAAHAARGSTPKPVSKSSTQWMHGFGGNPVDTAKDLKAAGFTHVVAGGADTIAAVRDAGMKSWLCGGAFGLGNRDDSYKAHDILGEPQVWFGSGCPNHPDIREANRESYRKMAETEGVEGILVDGCRFASPASRIRALFTSFTDHDEAAAKRLELDYARMKRDVRTLYDALTGTPDTKKLGWLATPAGVVAWLSRHPGVTDWLAFRRTCATEHFRDLSTIIHDGGKQMGVYIFTPCIAPVVGQCYEDLAPFVDVFAPMIYRNYPDQPGEACLNWELTATVAELNLPKDLEQAALKQVLAWTDLSKTGASADLAMLRAALPPEAVGHQTAMARACIGANKTLAPIVYIDDPEIMRTRNLVLASGADGINFFVYKDNWAELLADITTAG